MQPLTGATAANITLSLGFINVVVSVHSAVGEDDSRAMHNACNFHDAPVRLKQSLACPACQNADASTFVKVKDMGEGFVIIPPEVIAKDKEAAGANKKAINLTMHPLNEVTGVLMPSGKSYYLSMKDANEGKRKAYTALSTMVRNNPTTAFMCKFTLRSATSLFQLTTAGNGTLVLRQMAEASLVREHPSIDFVDLPEVEVAMSQQIVEAYTQPFLVAEHGTGKSSIIAEYAQAQTPLIPAAVTAGPSAAVGADTLTSALEAMLAAATPITTPTKKATARKAAVRPRKTAAAKAS